jgi:thiol-disulfide isomerase/thioredoxin
MQRFFAVLTAGFLLFSATCAPAAGYDPPLTGEMVKLRVRTRFERLPEIMLSASGEGLKYLSEHKGKMILLNIWATWCPPCIKELPSLNALQLAMGDDKFQVVTVSLDQGDPSVVKKYMLTPYIDVNQDIPKLKILQGVAGIPVSLLLDQDLAVLAIYEGDADWNGSAARAVLEYYRQKLFDDLPMSLMSDD